MAFNPSGSSYTPTEPNYSITFPYGSLILQPNGQPLASQDDTDNVFQKINDGLKKQIDDLDYILVGLKRKYDSLENRQATYVANYSAAEGQISALQTVIPTLPAGSTLRQSMEDQLTAAEYKKFQAEKGLRTVDSSARFLVFTEIREVIGRRNQLLSDMQNIEVQYNSL